MPTLTPAPGTPTVTIRSTCQQAMQVHTWESCAEEDIEEEEAVRALVVAEDDSYLAYDEACKVRQLDGRTVPGRSSQWNLVEDSCVLKMTNDDKTAIAWCKTQGLNAGQTQRATPCSWDVLQRAGFNPLLGSVQDGLVQGVPVLTPMPLLIDTWID
ncbi:hypothetical protein EI94DRAFT_1706351 [Lactarius quietus]|nr:hypothetical protein EI94DRAFT_1706351 [Lactarius quietus]